jgi:hypothetical protein
LKTKKHKLVDERMSTGDQSCKVEEFLIAEKFKQQNKYIVGKK